jgi:hypothetical protein
VDEARGKTLYAIALSTGTPSHFAAVSYADGLLLVPGSASVEALR